MRTPIKCFALVSALIFVGLSGCKTTQIPSAGSMIESGMYKVAILYPNEDNATFDLDYYQDSHMPMVAGFLGENLHFYEIDEGIAGRTPDTKVPFVAIGYFYVADITAYNAAIQQNIDAIVGDFNNYTNVRPMVQISQVRRVR